MLIRQGLRDDSQSNTGENVSNQVYLVHYDSLLCGAKPKISPKIALVFAFPTPKQMGCKVSDNLLSIDLVSFRSILYLPVNYFCD